jgi:hypothetical protein
MMIGPDPMIRIFEISVRFGIAVRRIISFRRPRWSMYGGTAPDSPGVVKE